MNSPGIADQKSHFNAADEILGPPLARGQSSDVAILFGDSTITYGEINARVNRVGNALKSRLAKGERALLLLKDSPDFIAVHLGVMRIGGVAVALSTRASAKDVAYVIDDSEADVVVIDDEFLPTYRQALASATHRPSLVSVRGQPDEGALSLDDLLRDVAAELRSAPTTADDMAFWAYTSGTTGTPKAAVHCHGDVVVGDPYLKAFGFQPGERVFASSKMFFVFSMGHTLIGALRTGATVILYDGWPDGGSIAAIVERYRPTIMLSVPAFYRSLLRDGLAEQPAFKSVRCYLSAGESLPESIYRRWQQATGRSIVEGIGTTESIFMMVSGTPAEHLPGATGKPMPYVEAKLLDPEGRVVMTPDVPGILHVKMGSLCRGYWREVEKTQAAFQDGWFRTGDVFIIGADGWWRHQGRGDDLLKISGQWVSPAEIEECAATVPGVIEAVVVGAPDRDGLIRLAMFLVAERGSEKLKQQVQEKLLQTLSKYKCPRNIVFVDVVPRTATGKVRRFRLRQWLSADLLGRLTRALNLDLAEIERSSPQIVIDMQRTCAGCEHHDRCALDLGEGRSAETYQSYCPNAKALVDLRRPH